MRNLGIEDFSFMECEISLMGESDISIVAIGIECKFSFFLSCFTGVLELLELPLELALDGVGVRPFSNLSNGSNNLEY